MNAVWAYFWPCFAAGLLVGAAAGTVAFRRPSRRNVALATGVVAGLILAAFWHGPLGGAARFQAKVEHDIVETLVHYEMTQVRGRLHQHPLSRRVMLSGPADDFQRQGLVQFMDQIPGVESATWSSDGGGTPLILEGLGISGLGFLFGLMLAYLADLRRRYNAQWNW